MRVIQITTVHPWNDSRIYKKIVLSLVDSGFTVDYIAPLPKESMPDMGNVNCHWLPNHSGVAGRMIRNILAFIKVVGIKARIVHFHDPEFLPFALLLRLFGKKLVYDVHEDNLLALQQKEYSQFLPKGICLFLAKSFSLLEQIASRAMVQVIAEKCYRYRFPRATEVLNYPKVIQREKSPAEFDPNREIQLLYTGVVSKDRGAFHMLRLVKEMKRAKLTIVGRCDRNLRDELYAFAGRDLPRILFKTSHRHVPFSYIEEQYARYNWTAGLAIFPQTPHYYEKELTKFFEYMYYGIPILCSNFPVWYNLIEKNKIGFTVNPEDISGCVAIINRLSKNGSLRSRMAQRAKELVLTTYNWKSQLYNLQKLYNAITQVEIVRAANS